MLKVILVEDEAIIRKALHYGIDWLSLGCSVVAEAETGEGGLQQIRNELPDIVITDIRMADMSGLEMLAAAKQDHTFKSIILTGYSEFAYAQKAIELGASAYILKPIDERILYDELKKIVQTIVEARSLEAARPAAVLPQDTFDDPVSPLLATSTNYYVQRVLQRLHDAYASKISIDQLSAEYGVSNSYLSRLVKAETGQTFQTLLQRQRIHHALPRLATGEQHIYEVGESVGYDDYKRFCSIFKKHVGLTPSDYVTQYRQIDGTGKEFSHE